MTANAIAESDRDDNRSATVIKKIHREAAARRARLMGLPWQEPDPIHNNVVLRDRPYREYVPEKRHTPTMTTCVQHVAHRYHISPEDLIAHDRHVDLITPRHLAFYLCKLLCKKSLPAIARHFEGRDHTTVLYGIRKIEARCKAEPVFRNFVRQLTMEAKYKPPP